MARCVKLRVWYHWPLRNAEAARIPAAEVRGEPLRKDLPMRLRLFLTVLALACFTAGVSAADTHPVQLASGQPQLRVDDQSRAGLRLSVDVGQLEGLDVNTKGGTFTRLLIPGSQTSKTVGAPELPMMNRLLL